MKTANTYVIKRRKGLEIVTIKELESLQFSVQHLLDAYESFGNCSDSVQLQITPQSHIMIATTQNDRIDSKLEGSIKLMKVPIAEM